MKALLAAALVGVFHVHHAPSHDTDAPFETLIEAAHEVGLDFVVLTDHYESGVDGPLPAIEHRGLHRDSSGHGVRVLVGVEVGTTAGHLLALDVPRAYANLDSRGDLRDARELIARVHADRGFAVVPHPTSHGGWSDWDADFDGMEIQNNASDWSRQLGPLLPLRLGRYLFSPEGALKRMLARPTEEIDLWQGLLARGRRTIAFAGADAHRNASLLGHALDPYPRMFRLVHTFCPEGPLDEAYLWQALREGACWIRWRVHEGDSEEAKRVELRYGGVELVLSGGRTLEVRNPTRAEPPREPPDSPAARTAP